MSVVVVQASALITDLKECILRHFYEDTCADPTALNDAVTSILAYRDHITVDGIADEVLAEIEEHTELFLNSISRLLGRDISHESFDLLICPASDIMFIKFT